MMPVDWLLRHSIKARGGTRELAERRVSGLRNKR
jgi:hypothetical protein